MSKRNMQPPTPNPRREVVIVKLSATADQARRATRADGAVNAAPQAPWIHWLRSTSW